MIKVLFADDEPKLRQAWVRLFAREPDLQLVGVLDSANGLVDAVGTLKPDVAIVDLSMPGSDPLDEIRRLRRAESEVRTIVYSGYSDVDTVQAAIDAGAWGFVDKLAPPGEMFAVVRRVVAGELVVPSTR